MNIKNLFDAGGVEIASLPDRIVFSPASLKKLMNFEETANGPMYGGRVLNQQEAAQVEEDIRKTDFFFNKKTGKFQYTASIAPYADRIISALRGTGDENVVLADVQLAKIQRRRVLRKNENALNLQAGKFHLVRDLHVESPNDVAVIYQDLKHVDREKFVVLAMDENHNLLGTEVVSVGTLNYNLVHPREVFKTPILLGAKKIVCLHNHPSGTNEPSDEDIALTKRLVKCGKVVGIELEYQLVIARDEYSVIPAAGAITHEKMVFTEKGDEPGKSLPEYEITQKLHKTRGAVLKPRDAMEATRSLFLKDEKAEIALMLDTRNNVVSMFDVKGATAGDIMRRAVLSNAASVVVCRGEETEETKIREWSQAGKLFGIEVMDVVEIHDNATTFVSHKQRGLMEPPGKYLTEGEEIRESAALYQPDLFDMPAEPEPKPIAEKEGIQLLIEKELLSPNEKSAINDALAGAGGKEKAGADGRGLLDEFYTPPQVVDKMWAAVARYMDPKERALSILEPSIGVGRFFQTQEIHPGSTVTGLEINPVAAKAAQLRLEEQKILGNVLNKPFEAMFMDDRGNPQVFDELYDLVIGNPPYGDHRGRYKGLGEEKNIPEYSEYFLKRALDLTYEGGVVAFVMPSGFLRNKDSKAKTAIAQLGNLVEAFRLPNGIFPTTDIGTDLVIFQKDTARDFEEKRAKLVENNYFEQHPEHIIGTAAVRSGRFGQEPAVEGSEEDLLNYVLPEPSAEFKPGKPGELVALVEKPAKTRGAARERAIEAPQEALQAPKADKTIPIGGIKVEGLEREIWLNTDASGAVAEGFMARHSVEQLKDQVNYHNGRYYNNFNYFQGDIYAKLNALEAEKDQLPAGFYEKQKAGLEAVVPPPATIHDVRLLPIDPLAIEMTFPSGEKLLNEFDVYLDMLPHEAFEDSSVWEVRSYLDGRTVTGWSPERNADERRRRKEIGEKLFNKFLKEELAPEKQDFFLKVYNEKRNAYCKPDYSKVPLFAEINSTFKGKPVQLRDYQLAGIGFLVNKGVGCLGHEVGAGKTMSAIIATHEMMTRGWIKRPIVVVPRNVYKKWIAEARDIVPGIKINELGNLSKKYLPNEKLEIEEGTWTVVTTEGLNRLGFKQETYDQLLGKLQDTIAGFNTTKRQQAKEKEKADEMIGAAAKGTSAKFFFEEAGFDFLVPDEMHRYKNIFVSAKMEKGKANEYRNVRGGTSSARAVKMYMATQYLLGKHRGRGVLGLTATPFTNSPIEYYSVLSLLAKEKMESMGLSNVNVFMTAFMDMRSSFVVKADRTLAQEDVIERFKNARQLRQLITEYIDIKTGEELGIQRPEKHQKKIMLPASGRQWQYMTEAENLFEDKDAGGAIVAVTELQNITLSPYLSRYFEGEAYRVEQVSDDFYTLHEKKFIKVPGVRVEVNPARETFAFKTSAGTWNVCDTKTGILIGSGPSQGEALRHARDVFKTDPEHIRQITEYPRLSPRFKLELAFDYKQFVNDSPKVKWTMDAIKIVKEGTPEANQVIYMPRGIEYHPLVKEYLVKELGYKEDEVEIVNGMMNNKEEEIEEIKHRFNAGEIKVLIGSEVIKEGMDLQVKTTDLYDLHLPWNPVDLDQVEGRVWRFGNEWSHVRINYPLIENSVDPFIFQKLETKQKRIQHATRSTENEVDVSDLNFEELKLDLITDPARRKQAEMTMIMHGLDREINVLKAEVAHLEYIFKGRDQLTGRIENIDRQLDYQRTLAKANPAYLAAVEHAEDRRGRYARKLAEFEKRLEGMDKATVEAAIYEKKTLLAVKEKEVEQTRTKLQKEVETLRRMMPATTFVNDNAKASEKYQASLEQIRKENAIYLARGKGGAAIVKEAAAGSGADINQGKSEGGVMENEAIKRVYNEALLQSTAGDPLQAEKYIELMEKITHQLHKATDLTAGEKKQIAAELNDPLAAPVIKHWAKGRGAARDVIYSGVCMINGGDPFLHEKFTRANEPIPTEGPFYVYNKHLMEQVKGLEDLEKKFTSVQRRLNEEIYYSNKLTYTDKRKTIAHLNSHAGAGVITKYSEQTDVAIYTSLLAAAPEKKAALDNYQLPENIKDQVQKATAEKGKGIGRDL